MQILLNLPIVIALANGRSFIRIVLTPFTKRWFVPSLVKINWLSGLSYYWDLILNTMMCENEIECLMKIFDLYIYWKNDYKTRGEVLTYSLL